MLTSKPFLPAYDQNVRSKMTESQDSGGYKVWQCTDCNYRNKKTSHLYRHIERKHFSVALSCDLCSLTFNCKETFATHRKRHC
jgi:Zn-finger protein